jgi:hypothetical protein
MNVSIDPDDIVVGPTDDRGRIYLGKEHANQRVEVAILDVGDTEQ